jgi:hypothetical protein
MQLLAQKLLVMLAALTVLIAGVTCTSAGCLLPLASAKVGVAKMSCCTGHRAAAGHSGGDSKREKPHHCPVCDQPLVGTSIQKVTHISAPQIAPIFIAPSFSLSCSPILAPTAVAALTGASPPTSPPTLVHLHCALLI